jgi:hypothetical protein
MNEDVYIPMVLFGSMTVIFVARQYYRFRSRLETQHTFRLALEKGSELSPEFIKQLGEPARNKDHDLRRGLVALAFALGFATLGAAIPDPEATPVMLGVAAFPFFMGIAFIIMHRFGNQNES